MTNKEMICKNCKFFEQSYDKKRKSYTWGKCHRYPPSHVHFFPNRFVIVDSDDWCGEFKQEG